MIQELQREVLAAIDEDTPGLFPALRMGLISCLLQSLLNKMKHHPELFLEAAIPYKGRIKN